jgi:hypothetical protein
VAIERLPLSLAISPDYPHVEVWSESGISGTRLREKIKESNKPISRQDAFNDVSEILNCDSLDVVPEIKDVSRPGALRLGFKDDTDIVIRVTNYTDLISLCEHQREGIQKSLYGRFHLGDGWDKDRIKKEKANIKYARLVKFDVEGDISSGQLCSFYGYLKIVLASHKSHKNGYCVVSTLPKEDSDPEGNRKITAPLFNGASTQPSLPSTKDNISTVSDSGRKAPELPREPGRQVRNYSGITASGNTRGVFGDVYGNVIMPTENRYNTSFGPHNKGLRGPVSGTNFDNKRDNQHIENVHANEHSTIQAGRFQTQAPIIQEDHSTIPPPEPGRDKKGKGRRIDDSEETEPLSSSTHADPLRRMGWSATYGSMIMHRWDGRTWVPAPDEGALLGGYDTRPNAKEEDASLDYLKNKTELEDAKAKYDSLQDIAEKIPSSAAKSEAERARKHYEKKEEELKKDEAALRTLIGETLRAHDEADSAEHADMLLDSSSARHALNAVLDAFGRSPIDDAEFAGFNPTSNASSLPKVQPERERPRLNALNTLLMRRGDGSSGKNALNTILYAHGISPMHDVEFPDKIPYGQHCEHYLGPSVAELIKVSGEKGLEARPHDPEEIRESGIDNTKGFILLKPMDQQKSHYVAMVRPDPKYKSNHFHVSDSLDQDSARKERYSPIANNALTEYQRQHNVTVDGAITFHQQWSGVEEIATEMEQATIEDDNRSKAPSSSQRSQKIHHHRGERSQRTDSTSGSRGVGKRYTLSQMRDESSRFKEALKFKGVDRYGRTYHKPDEGILRKIGLIDLKPELRNTVSNGDGRRWQRRGPDQAYEEHSQLTDQAPSESTQSSGYGPTRPLTVPTTSYGGYNAAAAPTTNQPSGNNRTGWNVQYTDTHGLTYRQTPRQSASAGSTSGGVQLTETNSSTSGGARLSETNPVSSVDEAEYDSDLYNA